jgi:hypothetical protein
MVDVATLEDVVVPVLDILVVTALISVDIAITVIVLALIVVFAGVRELPVEEIHIAEISGSMTWVEHSCAEGDPVVQDDGERQIIAHIRW